MCVRECPHRPRGLQRDAADVWGLWWRPYPARRVTLGDREAEAAEVQTQGTYSPGQGELCSSLQRRFCMSVRPIKQTEAALPEAEVGLGSCACLLHP